MNKKTFDQTLNQLKKTLVANYRSVQITELDTSKFKYVNDLSYNVDTKNWRIQIDYNKSDEDGSIKRVADRSIGIYFYDQSKSDNTINKSIFVYSWFSTHYNISLIYFIFKLYKFLIRINSLLVYLSDKQL